MSRMFPEKSGTSEAARVLLVDDHPMVRERLAEVLAREPDLRVCGEAEDRATAMGIIAREQPDLVIADLTLKNSDGLELIKQIREHFPRIKVLVVSMHDESLYAERSLRAGAMGYITKQEATRNILQAIRCVLAGNVYLSETATCQVLSRMGKGLRPVSSTPVELLADRELQVFQLTGRGLSTRQIAEELHIGVKTVETYRARIREKLNLRDPGQLLQEAIAWTHGT